jgi:hypothetical protein
VILCRLRYRLEALAADAVVTGKSTGATER